MQEYSVFPRKQSPLQYSAVGQALWVLRLVPDTGGCHHHPWAPTCQGPLNTPIYLLTDLPWSPFTWGCRWDWAARGFHSHFLSEPFFFRGVQATGLWLKVTRSSCSCFAPSAICHFARMASALSVLSKHLPVAIWVRWCSPSNLPACCYGSSSRNCARRQPLLKILER